MTAADLNAECLTRNFHHVGWVNAAAGSTHPVDTPLHVWADEVGVYVVTDLGVIGLPIGTGPEVADLIADGAAYAQKLAAMAHRVDGSAA